MFPERQYQNGLPVCLEILYTVLRKTAVQKGSVFFVIISSSLFLKEQVWSKTTHFFEKYIKINCFKPMKHNKKADTLSFLLSVTKCKRKKNIERTFFVSAGAQKGWETERSGTTLPQYLPQPKK